MMHESKWVGLHGRVRRSEGDAYGQGRRGGEGREDRGSCDEGSMVLATVDVGIEVGVHGRFMGCAGQGEWSSGGGYDEMACLAVPGASPQPLITSPVHARHRPGRARACLFRQSPRARHGHDASRRRPSPFSARLLLTRVALLTSPPLSSSLSRWMSPPYAQRLSNGSATSALPTEEIPPFKKSKTSLP